MSMFSTGCCGADFRSDDVTFVGLWSLSVPLVLLFTPAALLRPLLGQSRLRRFADVLVFANMDLIRRASLMPGLRCWVAGTLYRLSPRLSGAVYRCFNFSLLCTLWLVILGAGYLLYLRAFR